VRGGNLESQSIDIKLKKLISSALEEPAMPAITIRNLSDETHRALKLLATLHGRSTEAEVRRILDEAVRPRTGLGTALARIGQELGGVDDLELKLQRDKTPIEPATFE